jgi:(p)ppGpp synthase/HD superfamily hydrolase
VSRDSADRGVDKRVPAYAPTNLELLNQLRRLAYAEADQVRVRSAYEVALGLFTAAFRPSGKPFLAHLVGTASILAELRGWEQRPGRGIAPPPLPTPVRLVVAGLLHAAYSHGEFGTSALGISRAKRERLRAAVGYDAEDLVARYTNRPFGGEHLPALLHGLNGLGPADREVLTVRLANELEEHLDLGILYCPNAEERLAWADRYGGLCVEMAERLGFPALAEQLVAAFAATRAASVPVGLRFAQGSADRLRPLRLLADNSSFLLPPLSHSLRPTVALLRATRQWVRRARHAARRARRAT